MAATEGETGNQAVARRLDEAAALLEAQEADRFRVRAYRRAAAQIRGLGRPVAEILRERGREGLTAIPGIGDSIARAIAEMVGSGRWALLERLRGGSAPEALFATLPGIGPKRAAAIHDALHVDTLEALEIAAHDGRLESVDGIGPKTAAAIRDVLATRLGRRRSARPQAPEDEPPVALLLEIDRLYRTRAAEGTLAKIAPRRFNPESRAWLPILHAERQGWSFTAVFSNTALAHRLGRTDDWVVVYFERDGAPEGQRTVVTERRGPLAGRRVVRGREAECRAHAEAEPESGARRKRA
jgi:hypothetical protein